MNKIATAATLLASVCVCASAQAQSAKNRAPRAASYEYSPYEQETIDLTLAHLKREPDWHPEGKVIEAIDIVTLEVSERRDPLPRFVNIFHVVSKRSTIEREVLVRPGDVYDSVRIEESARNLRALVQLSVVLCVAVKGNDPRRVRLVVITKDIWSLRLNSDINYSSGGLEYLSLQPSEMNLFGTHHTAGLRFYLDPASVTFGAQYVVPRLTSYQLRSSVMGEAIWNRNTGEAEGSAGHFVLGTGLITDRTKWWWRSTTTWRNEMTRRFVNAKLAYYDAPLTPQDDRIPFVYRTRRAVHRTSVTRSWGWRYKDDIGFGVEFDLRQYAVPDYDNVDPRALKQWRELWVPKSFTRLSPFVQYDTYSTDHMRVLDFEILGLQEDFSLGHRGIVKVYPALKDVGSTRSLVGVFSAGQYTFALRDGLVRVAMENDSQIEREGVSNGVVVASWRAITPRLGFGRVLVDTSAVYRYRNDLNRGSTIGGNDRLRGYPSNYLVGRSLVTTNLEFRSRPVELLKFQLGSVAFYDSAMVFHNRANAEAHQSVGVGVRALLPQLDRVAFRLDVGFPLSAHRLPPGVSKASFFVGVGQAFSMPSIQVP